VKDIQGGLVGSARCLSVSLCATFQPDGRI